MKPFFSSTRNSNDIHTVNSYLIICFQNNFFEYQAQPIQVDFWPKQDQNLYDAQCDAHDNPFIPQNFNIPIKN